MDYWNYVLWSDETKINLFGSDGVKHVWRKSGEEYKDKCVLPTVKRGGGRVMVCGCMSAADTDICDIFTNITLFFLSMVFVSDCSTALKTAFFYGFDIN